MIKIGINTLFHDPDPNRLKFRIRNPSSKVNTSLLTNNYLKSIDKDKICDKNNHNKNEWEKSIFLQGDLMDIFYFTFIYAVEIIFF